MTHLQGSQFSTYFDGSFFRWHKDAYENVGSGEMASSHRASDRKLTAILMLSNGDEYEGGDFMLRDEHGVVWRDPAFREKGTVVVFPSNVIHQVSRIESGQRMSVAGWLMGPTSGAGEPSA